MKFRDSVKELHITSQIVCHSALEVPRKITSVVFSLFPIISHVTAQMIKGSKTGTERMGVARLEANGDQFPHGSHHIMVFIFRSLDSCQYDNFGHS